MLRHISVTGLIVMLLAACQSGTEPQIDEDFGNAVRANVAVQTLNPDAGGPDDSASVSGLQAERAVEQMRSRTNQAQDTTLIQGIN
jgi:hypothetical protein